jgi:hypothetical protein
MRETERIADQLNRAFVGNAWHGPAVMEILEGVTAEQAKARPFEAAHSIWELALHIEAWTRACRRRLQGERAQLSDAEDFPLVTSSDETAWKQRRNPSSKHTRSWQSQSTSLKILNSSSRSSRE